MTQPDVLADAPQNPESAETPQIDYDALAEALTPDYLRHHRAAGESAEVHIRRYT